MFRQLVTILFLLAFITQTFYKAYIVADYYTNTAAFAKNCENKARPTLKCKGKCQMMKKLKQEEKKEEQNPERQNAGKNEVISSKSFFADIIYTQVQLNRTYILHNTGSPVDIAASFFHPPSLS